MPEIRQYQQEANPAGVVQVQPATGADFGSNIGEAVKGVGDQIQNAGDILEKRLTQKDISNVDVAVSTARNTLTQKLLDEKQKGTLNYENFSKDMADVMQNASVGIQSYGGQRAFDKLNAETNLEFSKKAIEGQAQLEGTKTLANFKQATDQDFGTLANDPTQFQSLLQKRKEWVDAQVAQGLLPAEHADVLKTQAAQDYAEGAVRGTFKYSPELARKQLDSGAWDQYLGESGRYKMDIEITRAQNAKDIKAARQEKLDQDAQDAKSQQIQNNWYNKLYSNGLSTDDVMFSKDSSAVSWQDKERFNKMIESKQKERVTSDNSVERNAVADLNKPFNDPTRTLKSRADIDQLYINGSINSESLKRLQARFVNGGSGAEENEKVLTSSLLKEAYQQIAKPNSMGVADPQGLHNYDVWQAETLDKIDKAKQNGTFSTKMLYDDKDPNYLGSNYSKYQRSMEDIIKDQANRMSSVSPEGEAMVSAETPDGKPVKIPASKVEAARKAGKIK